MTSFANSRDPPIAAGAGLPASMRVDEDPYEVLDDLMVVVEALCPGWPERTRILAGARMLL